MSSHSLSLRPLCLDPQRKSDDQFTPLVASTEKIVDKPHNETSMNLKLFIKAPSFRIKGMFADQPVPKASFDVYGLKLFHFLPVQLYTVCNLCYHGRESEGGRGKSSSTDHLGV